MSKNKSGEPIFNVRLSAEQRARLAAVAVHLGGLTEASALRVLIAEKYEAIKDALPEEQKKRKSRYAGSVQPEGLVYDDSPDFSQEALTTSACPSGQ